MPAITLPDRSSLAIRATGTPVVLRRGTRINYARSSCGPVRISAGYGYHAIGAIFVRNGTSGAEILSALATFSPRSSLMEIMRLRNVRPDALGEQTESEYCSVRGFHRSSGCLCNQGAERTVAASAFAWKNKLREEGPFDRFRFRAAFSGQP